jgi:hypothetical protein
MPGLQGGRNGGAGGSRSQDRAPPRGPAPMRDREPGADAGNPFRKRSS